MGQGGCCQGGWGGGGHRLNNQDSAGSNIQHFYANYQIVKAFSDSRLLIFLVAEYKKVDYEKNWMTFRVLFTDADLSNDILIFST